MKNSYCIFLLLVAVTLGCNESDSITNANNESNSSIESEKNKIINTYYLYSQKLIAQDYEGALALTIPGSNAEGRLEVCNNMWADGCQSYTDFTEVEIELDSDMLDRNYGRAKGNCILFDYCKTYGSTEYKVGFYSDCWKIDGQWKIDGINSNMDADWWRN